MTKHADFGFRFDLSIRSCVAQSCLLNLPEPQFLCVVFLFFFFFCIMDIQLVPNSRYYYEDEIIQVKHPEQC